MDNQQNMILTPSLVLMSYLPGAYRSHVSSSRVSYLIVGQREKEQGTIQPQSLREKNSRITLVVMRGQGWMGGGSAQSYLCDIFSACVTNRIKSQVE